MSDPIALINAQRAKKNLKPLKQHSKLQDSALAHSTDMAAHKNMSHTGSDKSSPFDRMKTAGYNSQYGGECIGVGQTTPEQIVQAWMDDPPHRQILLGKNYVHVGVAVVDNYWTADFASGMPDDPQPSKPELNFDLW